jgi:UDP-N-acetylmuramate dehydrogenase
MDHDHLAKSIRSPLLRQEPMHLHTTWKVGGPADLFVSLSFQEDWPVLLEYRRRHRIPFFVFGAGSNLLVRDGGVRGLVVKIAGDFAGYDIQGRILRAQGGANLSRLAAAAAEAGLTGLEFAGGIPGSIGGALLMNAGAYGGRIADVFHRAGAVGSSGEERLIRPGDVEFGYRHTSLMEEEVIIVWVELALQPGDPSLIREALRKNLAWRKERHPREPSAGSVFKNPPQGPAGQFIEKAGLKGLRIGGAQVSEMHANFIVNTGQATARDILDLMERVKEEVYRKFGIALQPEVRVIGY